MSCSGAAAPDNRLFVCSPQLPKIIVECIITSGLVYYISSFTRDFDTFFSLTQTYIVVGLVSASYGFMWGCLFADGLGIEMSTPIDLFQMLSSGIYGAGTIPLFMRNFSLFYFFIEAVSYQYWADVPTLECLPDLPCVDSGMDVLKKYSYGQSDDTVLIDYGFSLGWAVIFHLIGFIALKRVILKEGFY